ncbi:MAG: hypothetical protein ACK59M_07715 [Pseudomonadota bacterium]|jgi:hypothetical protein|nr:hypothetical protein [Xanthomonadaceae bacterium]
MARELERWLPLLKATAGGERRLREALAERRREAAPPWQPALAGVCCALLAAALLPTPGTHPHRPDISRALDLPPPPVVQVENGAAIEVPVASEGVRVVLVMDLGEGAARH